MGRRESGRKRGGRLWGRGEEGVWKEEGREGVWKEEGREAVGKRESGRNGEGGCGEGSGNGGREEFRVERKGRRVE